MTRRIRLVLLATAVLAVVPWVSAGPALASCAVEPGPPSPHRFVGVVTATLADGRIATVRTDAGAVVEVRGTTESQRPGVVSATSVDRRFDVGARYEFHPVNASSPYSDNACTATRLLPAAGGPAAPASGAADAQGGGTAGGPSGTAPRPTSSDQGSWAPAAGLAAAALAVGATLAVAIGRGRRQRPGGVGPAE